MTTLYSEKYYRDNWERFIKHSPESDYMNLEYALEYELRIFDKSTSEKLRHIYAQRIYDLAITSLKRQMVTIKELESGKSSLGYTTKSQEIHEKHRIVQRFEFNCLQARDFKEKYSLT